MEKDGMLWNRAGYWKLTWDTKGQGRMLKHGAG